MMNLMIMAVLAMIIESTFANKHGVKIATHHTPGWIWIVVIVLLGCAIGCIAWRIVSNATKDDDEYKKALNDEKDNVVNEA